MMPKLQITRGFATRDLQFGHHACGTMSYTPAGMMSTTTAGQASCHSGTMAGLPGTTFSTAAVFSTSGPEFYTPGDFNMQKKKLELELLRAQVGANFFKNQDQRLFFSREHSRKHSREHVVLARLL
jgi:hypothetical protein